jgi:tetratricopeptide (TPR) repeat protein
LAFVLLLATPAAAAPPRKPAPPASDDARTHYERGTSAYGLGDYATAATEYEAAYRLKNDSALLYNAAQSQRLAGNKPRALLLYQNYLRIYGDTIPNRAEVERFINTLKQAIASDERSASTPPTEPLPTDRPPGPAERPPGLAERPPAPAQESPTAITSRPAPAPAQPIYKKAWLWGVLAGSAAVVALGVGLGVGLGSRAVDPAPSFGRVDF